jgi:uncharacterized protein YggL (DUF469 family)
MNRRLRKKKRMGEFKEFGFGLLCDLRPGLSIDDIDALVDRLIVVVEARKLGFGGSCGCDDKLEGFVTRMGRGSASEDERTALAAFLAGEDAFVHHRSSR